GRKAARQPKAVAGNIKDRDHCFAFDFEQLAGCCGGCTDVKDSRSAADDAQEAGPGAHLIFIFHLTAEFRPL
ncbi:MAG: hypothetical protein WCC31_12035, partial [Terracidiphilus sp.]